MANKAERIAAVIRKNIADIIQFELHNPKLGFVTIPEVKVSKDISYAKVYVSFIKPEEVKEGMETLEHSKGFIRSSLAQIKNLKKKKRFPNDSKNQKNKDAYASFFNKS